LWPPSQNVDLLIWEHAINDHAQSAEGEPHDMLRFWLSRVQHIFRKNPLHSPPPPILILYLWKQDIGYRQNEHILLKGLGHEGTPLEQSLQVLQEYRDSLQIQVIHLPKLIPPSIFVAHRREFLDDRHHPACAGSHLIADILRFAILDHLAHDCNDKSDVSTAPYTQLQQQQLNASTPPLFRLLMNPNTRIESLSQWQPTNRISTLPITPESLAQAQVYLANIFPTADMPGREDRKFAYRLPFCDTGERLQLVTASTPKDKVWWLGVLYAGRNIAMTVHDDTPVPLLGTGSNVSGLSSPVNLPRGAYDWIDMTAYYQPQQQNMTEWRFSFCDTSPSSKSQVETRGRQLKSSTKKERHVWLHLLVAVYDHCGL
jgi:hypothetical protein